jgi:hypothetical protein
VDQNVGWIKRSGSTVDWMAEIVVDPSGRVGT